MNPRLLQALRGVWYINDEVANSYMPLVLKALKGEGVVAEVNSERESIRMSGPRKCSVGENDSVEDNGYAFDWYNKLNVNTPNTVVVIPIHGAITKYDQYCGPEGMLTIESQLKQCEANANVVGVVLDIDSGGGEASYLDVLAKQIASMKKPIVSYASSCICSAAYFLGIAAKKGLYVSDKMVITGSIGTMAILPDYYSYMESQGLPIHQIYADGSEEKNLPFRKAFEKDYSLFKAQYCNPFRDAFKDFVLECRPAVPESALHGSTYLTEEAQKLGLIDGIKSLDECIALVGSNLNTITTSENNNRVESEEEIFDSMHNNILSVLPDSKPYADGALYLRAEDAVKIDAAIANVNESLVQERDQLQAALVEKDAQIADMQSQLAALKSAPGTQSSTAKNKGEDDFEAEESSTPTWLKEDSPWMKAAKEQGLTGSK